MDIISVNIVAEQICIQQVRVMRRKNQLCILGIRQPRVEECNDFTGQQRVLGIEFAIITH